MFGFSACGAKPNKTLCPLRSLRLAMVLNHFKFINKTAIPFTVLFFNYTSINTNKNKSSENAARQLFSGI